ncbi:hypothetical protein PSH79_01045 [Pseudomonas sp. FP2196]|uniref:hypothetical protein n=1 Tax=Pseudomonas sp. FP2196 TaxID=2954086 RepID=UPI0027323D41|nr:hypothetical protein [Pseudomonas sp. FP2196]WLH35908.1 hypothetical protein PSH79_01045 [Pseudomonas sp. FP2196]
MGIVRKPGSTSSTLRHSTDTTPTRKRAGSTPSGDGAPVKIHRPDADLSGMEAVSPADPSPSVIMITPLHSAQVTPLHPTIKTLERYSLRAPANLPAANAQGLRVFKNRNYVDIAPGEIVLVRETGIAGEYRAALASESAALGPALFFDPRSKIWGLERPRPLPDPGTVIDIDRDQLIRDVRKDYAQKNRVHTGNDDSFEYTAAQEGTLVARGLKQFSPEQAAIIRSELKAVEGIFADAGHAIALKYRDADAVYESFFGAEHSSVTQRFADSVARGLVLSKEYQGSWGDEKFLGVDTDSNSAAWMYKRDFHGRLFINRKYMKRGVLSLSLGHEMLHTNRIDRFQAIGPNAADYFYLDGRLGRLLDCDSLTVYDDPERGVSEAIMRGGLTVDYLRSFSDEHDAFLIGVSDYLGIGDDLDLQAAVDLFNANPKLRAHLAANNADSLICAAKSMQTLHENKTEYAWLDSLIED